MLQRVLRDYSMSMGTLFSKSILYSALFLFSTSTAWAAQSVAEVAKVMGQVDLLGSGGELRPVREGQMLDESDTIITSSDGRVKLLFVEGGDKGSNVVVLGANSRLVIQRASIDKNDPGTRLLLEQGSLRSVVKKKYKGVGNDVFEVKTPNAVAGVRGTIFQVEYDKVMNSSMVATLQGLVAVRLGGDKNVMVRPGEFTTAIKSVLNGVREIKKDRVIQMRMKQLDNLGADSKDEPSRGKASGKSALFKSSNRTIAGRNQIERAEKISKQMGVPMNQALDFVRSDGTSDADKEKAMRRLQTGLSGGGSSAQPTYIRPATGAVDVKQDVEFTNVKATPIFINPVLVAPKIDSATKDSRQMIQKVTTDTTKETIKNSTTNSPRLTQ